MTLYKSGDVVLLPFPFTNLTTTKQRPAVIISTESFHARQLDVIVLAVTSHVPPSLNPEDHLLNPSDQRAAGLPKPSIVKCAKLLTIDRRLIRKTLGHLSSETLHQLKQRLLAVLA